MRPHPRISAAAAGLLLLTLAASVNAASTTNTDTTATTASTTDTSTTATSTTGTSTTDTSTTSTTGTSTTDTSTTSTSGSTTTTSSDTTSTTSGSTTTTGSSSTTAGSTFSLTSTPTVAGATDPTIVVPYTADAPFMQKSTLPEGTVFIAVGAVLGFLALCILTWRAFMAYSITRSVKRAAMASVVASDKKSAGGWNNPLSKPSRGFYSHAPDGSALSLEPLSSSGRPLSTVRNSKAVPSDGAGLFFSPTASGSPVLGSPTNRNSSYLPAGYYANPSSHPAGGAGTTTLGSSLNPNNRRSRIDASPPHSPDRRRSRRHSSSRRHSTGAGLDVPGSRDRSRGPSRPTSKVLSPPKMGMHNAPSSSSLGVNTGLEDLPGSRAPSAYLEELFENHGNGPRERF